MTIMRLAFACCLFAVVCTANNHGKIMINDGRIELEGRGIIDTLDHDDTEALLTAMYELCDYYNTCNESVLVPEHDRQFLGCCVPCDCSDICYVTGNCCRDKAGGTRAGNKVNEYGEVCTNTHPLDVDDDTRSYLLVSQCHPGYEGNARLRCEINTRESIDDVTPVYSFLTGLAYLNVHCARCNFQNTSLQQWDISMLCANFTPVHKVEKLKNVIEEGCQIVATPPNRLIPECYTQSLVAECERARYKNLCSTVREGYGFVQVLITNLCSDCVHNFTDICSAFLQGMGVSFEALIDINVYAADVSLIKEVPSCQDGKRFNDVEHTCLRLTCAPSQFKVEEREQHCIDLYTALRGVCLDYRLRLTMAKSIGVSFERLEMALSELTFLITPDSSLQKPYIIDYSTVNGSATYKIQIIDTLTSFTSVKDRLLELETKLHKASPLMPGILVEQDTDGNAFESMPLEEIGYLTNNGLQKENCNKMVAMSGMQICEMVMFEPGEYRTHGGVLVLKNGREFQSQEYVFRHSTDGKRYVQICLETYLSRKGKRMMRSGGNLVTMNKISGLVMLVWADHFLKGLNI